MPWTACKILLNWPCLTMQHGVTSAFCSTKVHLQHNACNDQEHDPHQQKCRICLLRLGPPVQVKNIGWEKRNNQSFSKPIQVLANHAMKFYPAVSLSHGQWGGHGLCNLLCQLVGVNPSQSDFIAKTKTKSIPLTSVKNVRHTHLG